MKIKQYLRHKLDHWQGVAAGKVLGGGVSAVLVETEQGRFVLNPEDRTVSGALIRKGTYGQEELDHLSSLIRPEDTVCVVGTHVGALLVPLSKLCREMIGIEANPATFKLLEMNVLLNKCHNVKLHNCAANDRETELEFVANRANSGGSKRMPLVKEDMYFYDSPDILKVKGYALDDLLSNVKMDVVVMDIEGSEYFALKGMRRHLENVRALQVEFLPHHLKNVAGVSVAEFLSPILPYFNKLKVPSQNITVEGDQIRPHLEKMYSLNQQDEGLIFEK